MAQLCHEIDNALRDLADTAGATVRFIVPGKGRHRRAVFTYNGRSRFDVLSSTPAHHGALNHAIGQAKRTLRSLGAAL
jgi:hypothetical protein